MAQPYDAIIIGGGHNGLTAAGYLGRAGFKTLVLERRGIVGGAAVTEEFHPGYRNSIASYTVSLLRPEIVRDLELKKYGYETIAYRASLNLFQDGRSLLLTGEEAHDRAAYARFSNVDYDNMLRFYEAIAEIGELVRAQWLKAPPDLGGGVLELLSMLGAGRQFRRLSPEHRHFLVQMFHSNATDIVERRFESEPIRNKFVAHCVSSNFTNLSAPGSAIPFFHNTLGEFEGKRGGWGLARGGMGAITQAMARSAAAHGVEIRTAAPVERILIERGRAVGIRLEGGEEIRARTLLSNCDPKRTFLVFVGAENLDPDFAADIGKLRFGHASLRMNLALKGMPNLKSVAPAEQALAQGSAIVMFPDRAGIEAGYRAATEGEIPERFYIDMKLPSALDDGLAPPGHHVMSILAKYLPYRLSGGREWDRIGAEVAERILTQIEEHMPGLRGLVVARQLLTPFDLERIFGLTEGDIFHGRHDLDQIFSLRPHPKSSGYRTPIPGLYLCGSGAHPGGGVSGAPGHNAAQRVIRDLKRRAA